MNVAFGAIVMLLGALPVVQTPADEPTSETNDRLRTFFEKHADADANKDGVLAFSEARVFLRKQRGATAGRSRQRPWQETQPQEIARALAVASGKDFKRDPLSFPRGSGLRIVSTGHSWVAPAMGSLPDIAAAAGLDGHRQRKNLSGGGTGSANSRWLAELGKFDGTGQPKPNLLPAIATGQWDVMTFGVFYDDQAKNFEQWIGFCLKYNPDMIFYIQDAWTGTRGVRDEESLELEQFAQWQKEIDDMVQVAVETLRTKYPGKIYVIPVGAAMTELLKSYYANDLPGIEGISEHSSGRENCLWRDGGHLGKHLKWWEGYCYYATLYKRSPALIDARFSVTEYNEALDKRLRESAWHAVTHHRYSGVTDKNGDGIADEIE